MAMPSCSRPKHDDRRTRGTRESYGRRASRGYPETMTSSLPPPDLDLVVLGGGGHVGLPLSLAFAEAGQRVGIYDISQPTLDRIASGEMPFKESGADALLAALIPTGRLVLSANADILCRT
jgi:hypothetical protein